MIDLHCHLLPSIDDGPETLAESIELAHSLSRSGYRKIAATPHMVPGTAWMPGVREVHEKVAALTEALRDRGVALEVVSGMEIALDPLIPDLLDQGRVLTLGSSSCLLIELPFRQAPPGWEQVIFDLLARGKSVLLAHPERCETFCANPALIDEVINAGVYLQVNWGSLIGAYGKRAERMALDLVTRGRLHCLASDSHGMNTPITRGLQKAMSTVVKPIGEQNLHKLTVENPLRLLRGEPVSELEIPSGMEVKQKPWWRFWHRRAC